MRYLVRLDAVLGSRVSLLCFVFYWQVNKIKHKTPLYPYQVRI